jgi:membrane dipeptidase
LHWHRAAHEYGRRIIRIILIRPSSRPNHWNTMPASSTCRSALLGLIAACTALTAPAFGASPATQDYQARVARVLRATPLIDGHNDWPETLREREGDKRWTIDLTDLSKSPEAYNTDIVRLRKGMVGGQFWSVYVSANLPGKQQVEETLEQIDLVKAIVARYPETFALARTAADVRRAHARQDRLDDRRRGGGQIDGNLSILRTYAALGAGYLTLTHSRTIEWADSATDNPQHDGLTPFGEQIVAELNRLGMLVDLSHVSEATMRDALRVSKAPVIYSHSGARAVDDHPRNVSDETLKLVAANGGWSWSTTRCPMSRTPIGAGRRIRRRKRPG